MHWIITSESLTLQLLVGASNIIFTFIKYRKLNDAQNRIRKSLGEVDGSSDGGASTSPQMPRSQSGISVRSYAHSL